MGLSAMWNAISFVQDLNSGPYVHNTPTASFSCRYIPNLSKLVCFLYKICTHTHTHTHTNSVHFYSIDKQLINDIFLFQIIDYLLKPDALSYIASSYIHTLGHCSTLSSFRMDSLFSKTLIFSHVVFNYISFCIDCIFATKNLFIKIFFINISFFLCKFFGVFIFTFIGRCDILNSNIENKLVKKGALVPVYSQIISIPFWVKDYSKFGKTEWNWE